jgi:hypothetical protein
MVVAAGMALGQVQDPGLAQDRDREVTGRDLGFIRNNWVERRSDTLTFG